jgi:hypothetical protein
MLESLLLFAACLLIGLIALAVCVYLAVTGALFTMDGMVVALIALTIGGVFVLNVVWSVWTGELRQILDRLRKKSV